MKPQWLKEHEDKKHNTSRYKMCLDCIHIGDQCGETKSLGNGIGKVPIYECELHKGIIVYFKSYACTEYEPKHK